MSTDNCNADNKGYSSLSSEEESKNYSKHWDKAYTNNSEEKLGWFETNLTPTLNLLAKANLSKSSRILNIGAGNTRLIDELIAQEYSNVIATDISAVALDDLESRVGKENVTCIIDDLTTPTLLNNIPAVDLWLDRAVLHFFTTDEDQRTYFDLLKKTVKTSGYVLFAEFNLSGAQKCSGLPVHRYDVVMLQEKLGEEFKLINNFNHTYITPSEAERPYVYALFKRI